MASSSSLQKKGKYELQQGRSIASPKLYDVFISYRGLDVKDTLAKQLYEFLQARGCRVFLDREEIKGADSIPFAIGNAICSSLVQIAIFSKGYAESKWCLDELVLMLSQTDALFIPVLYDVEPSDLRFIENEKSAYAAAFSYYRSKEEYLDKVDVWKRALASAADIFGYELSRHQDNLCEKIVSRVLQEMVKRIPLHVAEYPVGLDELVQDFERSCSEIARDEVKMVGIYGAGGSGKTTLAKELFNRKHSGYDASCFLSDVRESHSRGELHCLQSQLLEDLFSLKGLEIKNVHYGIEMLKNFLGRARSLLIVLDDIDHQDQVDALLPVGMLRSSSLVIITTRDGSMLTGAHICYRMKGLNRDQAKYLFCCHAFRHRDPPPEFEKLVENFLEVSGGLPLSLKVLGAHLYGRTQQYWELQLEKVRKSSSALPKLYEGKNVKKRKALYEVASNEVGLDELVEDFERHCQQMADGALKNNIVGIFGVEGSGKTTLAKQIFSRKRSLYGKSSFLLDVREAADKDGLSSLQNKLLNDLLSENQPKFSSTKEGISYIESVLERSPISSFLIVIDDVGHIDQLNALLPKYALTSNSLVIITTRDRSVLIQAEIYVRYKIEGMDQQHGRQLFCWHAFRKPVPQRGYEDLVEYFVEKSGGSPLSLRVLGGHFFGRVKKDWELELARLWVEIPFKIKNVLNISYDSLGKEEREIFMDIACFFTEKDQSIGIRIWKASGWDAEHALQILRNKRLVEVVKQDCWNEIDNEVSGAFVFRMDNHLRELVREMAKTEQNQRDCSSEVLKHLESKSFQVILEEARGRCYRCFNSIRNKSITYFIENSGTLPTLRWLQLYGKDSIPSWVPLQDLEGLRIQGRLTQRLWHQPQASVKLKELVCKFTNCDYMEKAMLRRNWNEFSKSLGGLNLLESLVLQVKSQENRKDIEIEWNSFEESVRGLNCLRTLGLAGLYINGEIALSPILSTDLWLNLEAITLSHIGYTSKVSISGSSLKSLKLKHMEDLIEVDLKGVETLKCLELIRCHKVKKLLADNLTQLEMLSIEKCWEIEEVPDLSNSNWLQWMRITCCEKLQNISGIEELSGVESITITCCPKLQSIPGFKYLKGLQYMILSDGCILSCISQLQELPSEFTVVMGRAATSFPEADEMSGIADVLYEFQSREEVSEGIKFTHKTQPLSGAIILCAMVDGDDYGSKYMVEGSTSQTIDLSWAGGKWIYTIVVPGQKQISGTKYFNWMPTSCTIEKGYILAANEGRGLNTLSILKMLTEQLYKTDASISSVEAEWMTLRSIDTGK